MKTTINLNNILKLEDLKNVKIRFNMEVRNNRNPIDFFKSPEGKEILLEGHYWNPAKKHFKNGQTTVGLVKIPQSEDLWLLFHVGKITADLNKLNAMGYKYKTLPEYEKYFGRLIVKFKNNGMTLCRNALSVIENCKVYQILPGLFDNDIFPGYENVNVSWSDLSRVIEKESWKTALQNQKGVYLITDSSNGKMYVGSAYGKNMILGRWKSYLKNGHGGNAELRKISFSRMKKHFCYSILEIFKSTVDDHKIISRENWWKETLLSREFGYNKN